MTKGKILNLDELITLGRAQEIDIETEGELVKEIISNIKSTMKKENLISLSAPGIGYNKRIFCVDFSDLEIKTFINPIAANMSGLQLSREICSSIPGREYIRPRNNVIDLIYQTPKGMVKTNRYEGVAACVFQHELDHLDGVTLEDVGLEIDEDFDKATEEDRIEILNMYLDSLGGKKKDLDEEINSNEELRLVSDRLRFIEALAKGDITLEPLEE